MKRIYESLSGNLLAPSAKEDYNIPYIDKKQVENYVMKRIFSLNGINEQYALLFIYTN